MPTTQDDLVLPEDGDKDQPTNPPAGEDKEPQEEEETFPPPTLSPYVFLNENDLPEELSKASGILLDDPEDIYRRRGYYYALSLGRGAWGRVPIIPIPATAQPGEIVEPAFPLSPGLQNGLGLLLEDHQRKIDARLALLYDRYKKMEGALNEQIEIWGKRLDEKRRMKDEYKEMVDKKEKSCEEIEKKIEEGMKDLSQLAKKVGADKDGLIDKRLAGLEKEVNGLVKIYQDIEDRQNKKFDTEYNHYESYYKSRRETLTELKSESKASLEEVQERIKALNRIGINIPVAHSLISIGVICSLVAGWFFSIWADNDALTPPGTLGHSNNLRFFLIDNLARLVMRYPMWELVAGLFVYIIAVGGISYLCYWLMTRERRRMQQRRKRLEKARLEDGNQEEEIEFDIDDEDKLMKTSIRSKGWYNFFLKMTPFLVFVFLTLIIVAQTAYNEHPGAPEGGNSFQQLMDVYSNQTLGTLIAFMVAGLVILYIARVMEPRYVRELKTGESTPRHNWEIMLTIGCFLAMIILMIFYKSSPTFSSRIGVVAMAGFIVSSLATGLVLGYGYRFRALQDLAYTLEYALEVYEYHLFQISAPYRVSYMRFTQFHQNMLGIQMSMQELIQGRNKLAEQLVSGRRPPPELPAEKKEENGEPKKERTGGPLFLFMLNNRLFQLLRRWVTRTKREAQDGHKNVPNLQVLTDVEAHYFPAYAKEAELILQKLKLLYEEIATIKEEATTLRKNEKIYRSLNDQEEAIQARILVVKKEINEIRKKEDQEKLRIILLGDKEKNLLSEGFFTGAWEVND